MWVRFYCLNNAITINKEITIIIRCVAMAPEG